MKIFISADIEGTTGIAHWDEADRSKSDYKEFRSQMTAEVKAACEGANQAGARQHRAAGPGERRLQFLEQTPG